MAYKEIPFDDFEETYINRPDGFLPADYAFEDPESEDESERQLVLRLDMVVPWRLQDGKVKFLSVRISTKEQGQKALHYLTAIKEIWVRRLDENFDKVSQELTDKFD